AGHPSHMVCDFLKWTACQDRPEIGKLFVPEFDAQRAYALLEKQVDFGPRVPGTPAHAQCLQFLEDSLKAHADDVQRQSPDYTIHKTGETVRLTNLRSAAFGNGYGPAHFTGRPLGLPSLGRSRPGFGKP
ncbi:MAG: hypothetical protein Q9P14_01440, partial [candidate division KSB1 bacterium]|nr:hypothetical protein [candidate division KSB1 bacterium]